MINVRQESAKMLKSQYNIEEEITILLFEKGIIREDIIRKILLKDEYKQRVEPNGKQILKGKLADKYCVSVELVEKVIR